MTKFYDKIRSPRFSKKMNDFVSSDPKTLNEYRSDVSDSYFYSIIKF